MYVSGSRAGLSVHESRLCTASNIIVRSVQHTCKVPSVLAGVSLQWHTWLALSESWANEKIRQP